MFLIKTTQVFAYDRSGGTNNGDTIYKGNFIDRTRIKSGDTILQDRNPFDGVLEYIYKHGDCTDRLKFNGDSFKRGKGNMSGDSRSDLYGELTIQRAVNQKCEDFQKSTQNNFIANNTTVRNIFAYKINDEVFWMPEAAAFREEGFAGTGLGDPAGPRTFKKEQPSDDMYFWVDDNGVINDYGDGGARLRDLSNTSLVYQYQNGSCEVGCTTNKDAQHDEITDRLYYSANPPNAEVYPDAPAANTPGGSNSGSTDEEAEDDDACDVQMNNALSWILCPVIQVIEEGVDRFFNAANNALNFTIDSNQTDIKTAWEDIRNIANILFIISFLVIIISQALVGKL